MSLNHLIKKLRYRITYNYNEFQGKKNSQRNLKHGHPFTASVNNTTLSPRVNKRKNNKMQIAIRADIITRQDTM